MWTTDSVYLLILGSGLLGGFGHCIGMCGPVVAGLMMGMSDEARRHWAASSLLFNLGRITTYTSVGGIMGITGAFTSVTARTGHLQSAVMLVMGALMVVMGLGNARLFSRGGTGKAGVAGCGPGKAFSALINRIARAIMRAGGRSAFFPLGLAMGFIPCGLSYTAYIGAAALGAAARHPAEGLLSGMLLLLLFGLGTTPALVMVSRLASLRPSWLRERAQLFAALLMTASGVLFIIRGLR